MTATIARRVALAVAWTVLLAVGLRQLDRTLASAPTPRGWAVARGLEEIPGAAGHLALPSYLPADLEWPPRTLRFRLGARPGWWLGVHRVGGTTPVLWIGAGEPPLPPIVATGARCVYATPHAHCDGGWHSLSRRLADGQVVFVLTTLRPADAARLLKGLQPEEPGAPHRASGYSFGAD